MILEPGIVSSIITH